MSVRHLTWCSCGICELQGAYNHAVPMWNGAPCLTTMTCDGYRVVCVNCHNHWARWDDKYMNAVTDPSLRPVPHFRAPFRQNDESLAAIAHS